ncbi:MAG: bifunctional riboflavin kinase/FAD synthetase [Betaproteobacteria bacterium]|nr:bifunctional riboflavin kinase/FAD synthetase [Betaproteobacteria bacterium]NCW82463.1 bifunctional riboflavin kinase/FAD synthetase [Betaproteobacteria bacterium]
MHIIRRPTHHGNLPPPPTVLTIGNFDGVHLGHRALLEAVLTRARQGQMLASLMTFWPHPKQYFAAANSPVPARICGRRDQWEAIAACGIDQLFALRFDRKLAACSAEHFIEHYLVAAIGVRHLVIGDDFRFGAKRRGDFQMLELAGRKHGFSVESLQSVLHNRQRVSSSQVREALSQGRFDVVKTLLGRDYAMTGHVIHGRKLGRELGFPTLNLRIDDKQAPIHGIFVVSVCGLGSDENQALPAVASLGTRPAVEQDGRFLLEVHLLDWTGQAYGRLVKVTFLKKLRDEAHYSSLEALKEQIARDCSEARAYFNTCQEGSSHVEQR